MKRKFVLSLCILCSFFTCMMGQVPEKLSYQAVIRDAANGLVSSQTVGMQISILIGGPTGTPMYVETHTPTTNANGLVSLEIGGGTAVIGSFAAINWAGGTFFIKTETDPAGGTAYSITGTTQLLSVPYALHAKTAVSAQTVATTNMQPFQAVNYIICTEGSFPSRSGSASADEPMLGEIMMFAGNFAPAGWAFCNGQLLNISSNTALFSILGTMYGGDGRTTFGLPDLRGRASLHPGSGPGLTTRTLGEKGGIE